MNNTNPNIHIGQALKQNAALRNQLEIVRSNMETHVSNVKREIERVQRALRIEYTGWVVLLKESEGRWYCVGVVDTRNIPDDITDDFDLALPVPNPATLPDFNGW